MTARAFAARAARAFNAREVLREGRRPSGRGRAPVLTTHPRPSAGLAGSGPAGSSIRVPTSPVNMRRSRGVRPGRACAGTRGASVPPTAVVGGGGRAGGGGAARFRMRASASVRLALGAPPARPAPQARARAGGGGGLGQLSHVRCVCTRALAWRGHVCCGRACANVHDRSQLACWHRWRMCFAWRSRSRGELAYA